MHVFEQFQVILGMLCKCFDQFKHTHGFSFLDDLPGPNSHLSVLFSTGPPPNAHAWSDKVIHVNDETNLWRKIEAFRAIKAVISEVDFKQTGYI